MADQRQKNKTWNVADEQGTCFSVEYAQLAVSMDIRDELQAMRAELGSIKRLLHCQNFLDVPRILRRISANTAKPKKAKG